LGLELFAAIAPEGGGAAKSERRNKEDRLVEIKRGRGKVSPAFLIFDCRFLIDLSNPPIGNQNQ
jgi:hypothetical protein